MFSQSWKYLRYWIKRFVTKGKHSEFMNSTVVLTRPIISLMTPIEGWLTEDEADLMIAVAVKMLTTMPQCGIVEIGSYCGRSTVVLASVQRVLAPQGKVLAIDPHEGMVSTSHYRLKVMAPTLEKFTQNMAATGLTNFVTLCQSFSTEVDYDGEIGLLFIDGLHDSLSVKTDLLHFAGALADGGYVMFHDYAHYFPGVETFVDELLMTHEYELVGHVDSMIAIRKVGGGMTSILSSKAQYAPFLGVTMAAREIPTVLEVQR